MTRFLYLVFLTLIMMVSADAFAAKTYVWTDAPEGNLVTSMEAFTATFTATKDDVINISAPETFGSVECGGVTYEYKVVYGTETGPYKYTVPVKSGQVITFKSDFWWNPGTRVYIVQGVVQLKVTNLSPGTQGQPFPWNTQGMVTVNFNKAVTATDAYIQCPSLNNAKFPVDDARLGGSSALSCNISFALQNAFAAGLQPGHPVLLKFEGVKDDEQNLCNNTGVVTIQYVAPQPQGMLLSATVGDGKPLTGYKFLSWFPTDGTEGLFVFEFSKEPAAMTGESRVELQMGNPDLITAGKFYSEILPCTVEGNKLIVDARGKLRSLARMFSSVDFSSMEEEGEGYFEFTVDNIGMQLKNVKDKDGNPMYSEGQGSVGSYSYTFAYEQIKDDIVWDGDRDEDLDGSVKESGSTVQLYVDQELKSVDGAIVYIQVDNGQGVDPESGTQRYETGQIKIAKEKINIISSSAEETIIGFTLPELKATVLEGGEVESGEPQMKEYEAAVGTKIRIVIQVNSKNGMPHDLDINYYYKSLPESSAIETVETSETSETSETTIFNLAGQKVGAGYHGIVIKNGKKIIVK